MFDYNLHLHIKHIIEKIPKEANESDMSDIRNIDFSWWNSTIGNYINRNKDKENISRDGPKGIVFGVLEEN